MINAALLTLGLGGGDDFQVGEPSAHEAPVTGNERVGAFKGMCADEKVWNNGKPLSVFGVAGRGACEAPNRPPPLLPHGRA